MENETVVKKPLGRLLLLIGLPASGKSTLTRELMAKNGNVVRINRDDLRAMSIPAWSGKREDWIIACEMAMAKRACERGFYPVIDDTNLNPKVRQLWKDFCARHDIVYEEQRIRASVGQCVARDHARGYLGVGVSVGRAVIENMARKYGEIPWWEYKKLVIVDLDGTLCDCAHRRDFVKLPDCPDCDGSGGFTNNGVSKKCGTCNGTGRGKRPCPDCAGTGHTEHGFQDCRRCKGKGTVGKDWKGFYENLVYDPPVEAVLKWVHELAKDHTIICVSGRPEDYQHQTVQWLEQHQVPYMHLFMRRGGDGREDFIVKREIAETLPLDQIAMVLDDRNQVVEMWRKLREEKGLNYHVFQVADGNF